MEAAESLVLEFPDEVSYRNIWVESTAQWASFTAAQGKDADGKEAERKLIETLEARVKEHPKDRMARTRLAELSNKVTERLLYQEKDTAAAEQTARRASVLFAELTDEFPTEPFYREPMAWSCRFLGEIARSAGRLDEAREHYEKAATAFAKLAADDIHHRAEWYRNWEADNLIQLAEVLAASGLTEEAATTARKGVQICEALTSEFPNNQDYRERMAAAQRVLDERLAETGQRDNSTRQDQGRQ